MVYATVPADIQSVSALDPVTVAKGSSAAEALPAEVEVTLVGGDKQDVDVQWSPAFDGSTPGTIVYEGTLAPLPDGVLNPDNLKASITVTVLNRIMGDGDGDGKVTPADALLIHKYLKNPALLNDEQKFVLDVDKDGDVDKDDATLILSKFVGKS
jgi:hypothetical protein